MTKNIICVQFPNFQEGWNAFRALAALSGAKASRCLGECSSPEEVEDAIEKAVREANGNYYLAPRWEEREIEAPLGAALVATLSQRGMITVTVHLDWVNSSPEGLVETAAMATAAASILKRIDLEP